MEVVLHGDESVKIEDLRKLRKAGIYFSPLLAEIEGTKKNDFLEISNFDNNLDLNNDIEASNMMMLQLPLNSILKKP